MAPPEKFCHAVFKTRRFEDMIDWYVDALEARIQYRNNDLAFLTYDEEHHRIALARVPGDPDDEALPATGLAHLAFAWRDVGALLDKYRQLKTRGILPFRTIRHGLTLSFYYEDPDRNQLEFQIDVLSLEEASEFMRSDAFAHNPSGDLMDPEELLARHEAGEPIDDLLYRHDQPQHYRA